VEAPAPASFGTSPAQIAVSGGPNFAPGVGPGNIAIPSAQPPVIGTVFPVLATSLQFGAAGAAVVPGDPSATATIVPNNCSPQPACNISYGWRLSIPSLGLNVTTNGRLDLSVELSAGLTSSLSYVTLGDWAPGDGQAAPISQSYYTLYQFGYETPVGAMPTTGTATFAGGTQGTEFLPVAGQLTSIAVFGGASISVDFASGKLTGALTQMNAQTTADFFDDAPHPSVPWNDVSLSASIAAGTNRFTGSAAAASNPQSTYSLSGSAKGSIVGAFYGPNAEELGAIWTLSDGNGSAIGGIGAKRQ